MTPTEFGEWLASQGWEVELTQPDLVTARRPEKFVFTIRMQGNRRLLTNEWRSKKIPMERYVEWSRDGAAWKVIYDSRTEIQPK